jgi:hypothetical protein
MLFDLARDPGEREPGGTETTEAVALREALARALPEGGRAIVPRPAPLSEERRRELRALGYLRD